MVEYKNQHYIPQFFMRGWTNENRLPSFHVDRGVEYPPTSIANLCSSDYFYSQFTSLEKALSELEDAQAVAINDLRSGTPLRSLAKHHRKILASFLTTQRMRTAIFRKEIRDSGEDILSEGLEMDFESAGIDPSEESELFNEIIDSKIVATHHYFLLHGIFGYITISDLEGALLINQTDVDFVFSDAPVIFDNWVFKKSQDLTYAGLANRGLQIYCPLSPRRLLMIYDGLSYNLDKDSGWSVILDDESTIHEFNQLQFLTADKSIFYRNAEQQDYMKFLAEESIKHDQSAEIGSILETEAGEEFEMRYIPRYQLYDLTPTFDSIKRRRGVRWKKNRRPNVDTIQRNVVRRIMNGSEDTESAVKTGIDILLSQNS